MSTLARHKRRKLKSEINVVPYIDVMLVLLIIFMVTAPLLSLSVDVDLPQSKARAVESKKDPVIVTVDAEGRYFLSLQGGKAEAIDATELSTRLSAFVAQNKDVPVFVAAPGVAEYQKVMDTMVLVQAAGVPRVSLMSQPGSQSSR
ncbi:protein TolR [Pseudoxanthomonas suwonensis]|uniref:protein TolR n=1 Tax=Pseudoxanthomonas suwonensis TaxID=314722 RepID=UPI000464B20C|nr:protein TolR [Pseudoxanthomonas suwonensis]